MDNVSKAVQYYENGYMCSQAVFAALLGTVTPFCSCSSIMITQGIDIFPLRVDTRKKQKF